MKFAETLKKAGLSEKEIKVFSVLLETGEQKIAGFLKSTDLKRGDLYYALESLVQKNLVLKEDKKKKLHFKLNHPQEIEKLLEKKQKEIRLAESELSAVLPEMVTTFNLTYNQPGVKVFEGKEGIERVIFDSLTSKTEILSYIDIETVEKLISSSSKKYYRKRKQLNLLKKNLIIDSSFSTEFAKNSQDEFTETRIIGGVTTPFKTTMTIYDNKISYITLKEGAMIGVIVEDKFIANMHKVLFKKAWESATRLT